MKKSLIIIARNFVIVITVIATIFAVLIRIVSGSVVGEYLEDNLPQMLKDYSPAIIITLLVSIFGFIFEIRENFKKILLQEEIKEKLSFLFNNVKKHSSKIMNDKHLNNLQDAIIKEAADQIDAIGGLTNTSKYTLNDEFKRVQFIRHLFTNSSSSQIFALTYDSNDYFINFWGGLQFSAFIEANKLAARHSTIVRFFVFKKSDFENDDNFEKRELYEDIKKNLDDIDNIHTYLIWEEDLLSKHRGFQKRSFLLIDNYITSEIKDKSSEGYLAFGHSASIDELNKRKQKLLSFIP